MAVTNNDNIIRNKMILKLLYKHQISFKANMYNFVVEYAKTQNQDWSLLWKMDVSNSFKLAFSENKKYKQVKICFMKVVKLST